MGIENRQTAGKNAGAVNVDGYGHFYLTDSIERVCSDFKVTFITPLSTKRVATKPVWYVLGAGIEINLSRSPSYDAHGVATEVASGGRGIRKTRRVMYADDIRVHTSLDVHATVHETEFTVYKIIEQLNVCNNAAAT